MVLSCSTSFLNMGCLVLYYYNFSSIINIVNPSNLFFIAISLLIQVNSNILVIMIRLSKSFRIFVETGKNSEEGNREAGTGKE